MDNPPAPHSFATRADGWTVEAQDLFLQNLAITGLVSEAARAAGRAVGSAYRFRHTAKGAEFALLWDDARAIAYENLHEVAMERIRSGGVTEVWYGGQVVGTRVRHDNRLLMATLTRLDPDRRFGERSATAANPADTRDMDEEIGNAEARGWLMAMGTLQDMPEEERAHCLGVQDDPADKPHDDVEGGDGVKVDDPVDYDKELDGWYGKATAQEEKPATVSSPSSPSARIRKV